jgi:hypothetical protein
MTSAIETLENRLQEQAASDPKVIRALIEELKRQAAELAREDPPLLIRQPELCHALAIGRSHLAMLARQSELFRPCCKLGNHYRYHAEQVTLMLRWMMGDHEQAEAEWQTRKPLIGRVRRETR